MKGSDMDNSGRDSANRSPEGSIPGSIGDVSSRLGIDVRELLISGYSHAQIDRVLKGDMTLSDLFQEKPATSVPNE
ncbi:MAG: hypothetical protein CMO55_17335 [Verrucomicrobiales bacterium]|nr:hypothetical protein [Verrucomicrobiales bacterium]